MKEYILDNLSIIITTLLGGGSAYGWWNERKKRTIEEKQLASDALKTMQDAYDKFTEDAMFKYKDLSEEVAELKKKLVDVTLQLNKEEGKYLVLKESYEKLKSSYENLKREFNNYKKKHSLE